MITESALNCLSSSLTALPFKQVGPQSNSPDQAGSKFSDLEVALITEDKQTLHKLLTNVDSSFQFTSYHTAAKTVNFIQNIGLRLIEACIQENAFLKLVYEGNNEVLEQFFQHNEFVFDYCIPCQFSSMHIASQTQNPFMIDLLHSKGYSLTSEDIFGNHPEHYAAFNKSHNNLEHLIKNGGSLSVANKDGVTPLDIMRVLTYNHSPFKTPDNEKVALAAILIYRLAQYYLINEKSKAQPLYGFLSQIFVVASQLLYFSEKKEASFGNLLSCIGKASLSTLLLSSLDKNIAYWVNLSYPLSLAYKTFKLMKSEIEAIQPFYNKNPQLVIQHIAKKVTSISTLVFFSIF